MYSFSKELNRLVMSAKDRKKTILFYSSVKDKELFNIQRFYRTDIQIFEELGAHVLLSNRIADAWKFWQYDFVFAYFYRYSFFVALIAKLFGKDTYFTGGIDDLDQSIVSKRDYIIQRLFFKGCYYLSKSCIIVSKTDDENVRQCVSGDKLSYSEHTIDTQALDCDLPSKEKLFTTIAWQGSVSNVQRKGVDTAIRLFAGLKSYPEYHDYRLVIIGKKGAGTSYLENLVSMFGVNDSVLLTDSISEEEKIDNLKRSKYYLQLSKYEGFGVAALEALCAKNIVVHSGKGGLSNPIYKDGILVDISKPVDEMVAELKAAIESYDEARLTIAHQNVCRNYDNRRRKEDLRRITEL